jgi:phage regulator Rha-like protein
MSQSTGASAPVYLTVVRVEETRRHPAAPEKISLDVDCRFDSGRGVFFILSSKLREIVPWKVGDRLKAVGKALYHPAKPDLNLFSNEMPWPFVPLAASSLVRKEPVMNEIVSLNTSGETLTMSSREIAELTNSRHDSVKRTIERLAESGVIRLPPMVDFEIINNLGLKSSYSAYVFSGTQGKRDSLIVVAQLCPEFTARIVDRWQELEAQQAKPALDLANPAHLRSALLSYTEKVIALEAKVDELKPKADALDRIATISEGSYCIRDAAKILRQKEKEFRRFLHGKEWAYPRLGNSGWIAYSETLQKGWMEHKVTEGDRPDGSRWVSHQARITAKGMVKLAAMLGVAFPPADDLFEEAA